METLEWQTHLGDKTSPVLQTIKRWHLLSLTYSYKNLLSKLAFIFCNPGDQTELNKFQTHLIC